MIETRQLEMLLAVAEHGSFAAAAGALRVTPSAVSQQMAALERTTRSALFERSTRGVVLTEAGRLLLVAAQVVHGELERTRRALHTLATGATPTLRIASFTSAGEHLIAPALAGLTSRYGQTVDVTVIEAEPDEAMRAVQDGRADLAVTYSLGDAPDGATDPVTIVRSRTLVADSLRLAVASGSPLAARRRVSWADLAGESWICGWSTVGAVFDHLARSHGLDPHVVCRSSDYGFMQALVAAGVGIALVPELALTDRHDIAVLAIEPTAKRRIDVHRAPRLGPAHPAHAAEALMRERAHFLARRKR